LASPPRLVLTASTVGVAFLEEWHMSRILKMLRKKRVPKPKLMGERAVRRWLDKVYEVGRERNVSFGDKFSPADFAAGAGVLLAYLNRLDLMPACWVFGMHLGGKNPFAAK
jgi:hypothetical protein